MVPGRTLRSTVSSMPAASVEKVLRAAAACCAKTYPPRPVWGRNCDELYSKGSSDEVTTLFCYRRHVVSENTGIQGVDAHIGSMAEKN